MKFYETFDHTADLGIVVTASSEAELFQNAAFAVFDIITLIERVNPLETRIVSARGESPDDLLVNYLREILYLYNGGHWLLRAAQVVALDDQSVEAEIVGEPYRQDKHEIRKEIKAVTYHQAEVSKTAAGWRAKVIFDV